MFLSGNTATSGDEIHRNVHTLRCVTTKLDSNETFWCTWNQTDGFCSEINEAMIGITEMDIIINLFRKRPHVKTDDVYIVFLASDFLHILDNVLNVLWVF